MLKILDRKNKEDEKILRQKSEEVIYDKINSPEIQGIVKEMFAFSKTQLDSAGMSAVQLGFLKRIFIVEPRILATKQESKVFKKDCVFINPKIIKHSKKKIDFEEGCLSVRSFYGLVSRSKNVTIEAYNLEGEKIIRGAGGLLAVIFQHEIDHLNGILFTDKAKNIIKLNSAEMKKLSSEFKKTLI